MAYATSSDYLTYTGTSVAPTGVDRLLEVASTRLDEILLGAVYAVDVDGNPTDAEVITLLSRATCEQALYMVTLGDTTGTGAILEQTIGRVSWRTSLSRGASATEGPSRYSPEALAMLHVSGLIPPWVTR